MKRYKNLSGKSGVLAYEVTDSSITVKFRGSDESYVYDSRKPGRAQVARMKELAESGRGLSTFISRSVRENFSRKES